MAKTAKQSTPTTEPATFDPRAAMVDYFTRQRAAARETIDSFGAEMARDPAYMLDGCERAFAAAARGRVLGYALAALTKEGGTATVESIRDQAHREAMNVARFPNRSTSPTANLFAQCMGEAWAEVYELARDIEK